LIVKNGQLKLISKRTVVLAYPSKFSNPTSNTFYKYWSIYDENNQSEFTEEDNPVGQQWYITKFNEFRAVNDILEVEMIDADVHQLRRIRNDCEVLFNEEEEALREHIRAQVGWMQVAGLAPLFNYSNVPDD